MNQIDGKLVDLSRVTPATVAHDVLPELRASADGRVVAFAVRAADAVAAALPPPPGARVWTALFAALNKRYVTRGDPASITFVQMASGGLFLALIGSLTLGVEATLQQPSMSDFGWLLLLALVCTLLPFLLFLRALRHITAFTTQLALNLEPVYAIILAALLFREYTELTPRFYLGVALILAVVFAQPYLQRRLRGMTPDSVGS